MCCYRQSPSIDYLAVAVAYVMAALFGFLCHAPASLGAFEVAMLFCYRSIKRKHSWDRC